MSSSTFCFLCRVAVNPSEENACQHCHQSIYACSNAHLKAHRGKIRIGKDNYQEICWPFRVENRPIIGNVLIATRSIKATETVLEELPAALGHHAKTKPCCIECGAQMDKSQDGVEQRCENCNFPLCNKTDQCRNKEQHQSECDIMSTYNLTEIDWEDNLLPFMAVLPIRVLSLKKQNPELWNRIMLLMDHNEAMKEDEKLAWQSQVVEPILSSGKRPDWSAEDILRVIGIVNTNGVSLGGLGGCGLYPTFSFLSHSCTSNCRFQIHHNKSMVITALTDIEAGEELTIKYLPCTIGNTLRRSKIAANWKFDCCCRRCQDPTEFGTYFDALKCYQKTCGGYLLPKALETRSDWKCDKCSEVVPSAPIQTLIKSLQEEAENFQATDINKVQTQINNLEKILHPHHFLLMSYKKRLLDILKLRPDKPEEGSDEFRPFVEKQVDLGNELLAVTNVLEPGFSFKRGRLLRHLHLPTLQLAKMDLKAKRISMPQFVSITKKAIQNMKEAVRCMEDFDLGPDTSTIIKNVALAALEKSNSTAENSPENGQ